MESSARRCKAVQGGGGRDMGRKMRREGFTHEYNVREREREQERGIVRDCVPESRGERKRGGEEE